MDNIKPLAYRTLILILILVCMNYIYKYTFFEKDIQTHSKIINLVKDVVSSKDEIVYVGESSDFSSRDDDKDNRAISSFIGDYFPSKKIGKIIKEASHAGIYYELLRNIPKESNVKTIIVTLNLRSFDANWIYSNLETPLQKSIVLLKDYPPLYNRFLLSFRGYDIKTDSERERQFKRKWKNDQLNFPFPFSYKNVISWNKGMVEKGIRNSDNSFNYPLTELACHYIKTYAFQIDTLTNPRIKDFDKIVSLSRERGWNLIFNLLAENTEKAKELVGDELVFLMKQNRDLLINRYYRNNVIVVDNLESVPSNLYIDQNWTTEHYAEIGRKTIAKNVAKQLAVFYPKEYSEVAYSTIKKYDFYNDCEGNANWEQMQTITSEKSFSGNKSSKTGQKNDFSITFKKAICNLPDSLKQISIAFQSFQNDLNHDTKLIIEISGENIKYQWNGIFIKDLSKILNKWDKINYVFPLDDNFYNSDLIKIYIYNPTNSLVYIDDFRINFQK